MGVAAKADANRERTVGSGHTRLVLTRDTTARGLYGTMLDSRRRGEGGDTLETHQIPK